MNSVDETIIELSKTKIGLLILGAGAFVAVGAWLLSLDEARIRSQRGFLPLLNQPTYVYGIGIVSILFFGLCGLFGLKKLFDKKPGLVLNSFGIVDNASGISAGSIPWSEVLGSAIFEIQRQRMLIIKVRNPQKYVDRGSSLRRALNKANYKMCGSPIAISSNALKINFSELVALFSQYERKYVNQSK